MADDRSTSNRGVTRTARGLGHKRRLVTRCDSKDVRIPKTLAEFEKVIAEWISTCVQSRTIVHGRAALREEALVHGNPWLKEIWDNELDYRERFGHEVRIFADYKWGQERVEAIRFTTRREQIRFAPEEIIAPRQNSSQRKDPANHAAKDGESFFVEGKVTLDSRKVIKTGAITVEGKGHVKFKGDLSPKAGSLTRLGVYVDKNGIRAKFQHDLAEFYKFEAVTPKGPIPIPTISGKVGGEVFTGELTISLEDVLKGESPVAFKKKFIVGTLYNTKFDIGKDWVFTGTIKLELELIFRPNPKWKGWGTIVRIAGRSITSGAVAQTILYTAVLDGGILYMLGKSHQAAHELSVGYEFSNGYADEMVELVEKLPDEGEDQVRKPSDERDYEKLMAVDWQAEFYHAKSAAWAEKDSKTMMREMVRVGKAAALQAMENFRNTYGTSAYARIREALRKKYKTEKRGDSAFLEELYQQVKNGSPIGVPLDAIWLFISTPEKLKEATSGLVKKALTK